MKAKAPAQIRIIGGLWKRTPIRVVQAEGLRPTPDRVRETLFNWIGDRVTGAVCLDLFSGTGALGFEAASRGAARVCLVETAKAAQQQHLALKTRLNASQIELCASDALGALARYARKGERFDLVFLDPPFGKQWLGKILPLLPAVLAPEALIYLESDSEFIPESVPGSENATRTPRWQVNKAAKAGQVHYHLLQLVADDLPFELSREN